MPEPLTIFVPGKPISVNAAYRHTGRRVYMTHAAFEWKQTVVKACLELRQKGLKPPLAIRYRFTGVRGDADNYLKLCQDGVAAALWLNDKHFSIAHASASREGEPGVWLEIQEAA